MGRGGRKRPALYIRRFTKFALNCQMTSDLKQSISRVIWIWQFISLDLWHWIAPDFYINLNKPQEGSFLKITLGRTLWHEPCSWCTSSRVVCENDFFIYFWPKFFMISRILKDLMMKWWNAYETPFIAEIETEQNFSADQRWSFLDTVENRGPWQKTYWVQILNANACQMCRECHRNLSKQFCCSIAGPKN